MTVTLRGSGDLAMVALFLDTADKPRYDIN
jgi:RPE4 domain-containing protein